MKKTILSGILLTATLSLGAVEFFVAPPAAIQKDPKVVATSVADALKKAKSYRSQHPGEKITLIFHAGTYPLTETAYITPELNDLTLVAAPGETVVFDGGVKLKCKASARLNSRSVLVYNVPQEAVADGFLDQLYVNGIRADAARTPKSYDQPQHPEKFLPEAVTQRKKSDYFYKEGDFDPKWHNIEGIDLHLLSAWYDIHTPIASFDAKERKIHLPQLHIIWSKPEETGVVWRNVREALTEKGEYYFDNKKMELYYIPRDGETAENAEVVVPVNSLLFLAAGDEQNHRKVSGITLDGITFRHGGVGRPDYTATYQIPGAEKYPPLHNEFNRFGKIQQGASYHPAVISFQYADCCRVVNCKVEKSNFYAIGTLSGVTDLEISHNVITDMGTGGILIGGVDAEHIPEKAELVTERITIRNNHIFDCGKFTFAGLGILIGFARGTLVEHNLIHDLYYSGISAGWSWGYAPATGGENRIGFNHIYNIGKKMLSDMGGIYLLGIQPGTRVYNNLVHDVSCRVYGGWALYADEGSAHEVWENNVCYDCTRNAFHQHYGRENTVRNNVFAFCDEELVRISICEPYQRRGYRFPGLNYSHDLNLYGNILLSDGKAAFRAGQIQMFSPQELYSDGNLYFDIKLPAEKGIVAAKNDASIDGNVFRDNLAAWQKRGFDRRSAWGDPGFVDPAKRDFHLKKDALARKLGFADPAPTLDYAGLLPASCIPAPQIEKDRYDWSARHAEKYAAAQQKAYPLLFIGDSLTHYWSNEAGFTFGGGTWEKNFADRALNLGFGFDRTQNVLWRIGHGEIDGQKPEAVVLEIGTNQFSGTANYQPDTPLDAYRGIRAVITALREKFAHPTMIYVMAIFPRRGLQKEIDETNAMTREFCATVPYVKFIDLKAEYINANGEIKAELYQKDGTHLSVAGYEIWAKALQQELNKK